MFTVDSAVINNVKMVCQTQFLITRFVHVDVLCEVRANNGLAHAGCSRCKLSSWRANLNWRAPCKNSIMSDFWVVGKRVRSLQTKIRAFTQRYLLFADKNYTGRSVIVNILGYEFFSDEKKRIIILLIKKRIKSSIARSSQCCIGRICHESTD